MVELSRAPMIPFADAPPAPDRLPSLRERRIENEWAELDAWEKRENNLRLLARGSDNFRLEVAGMPALVSAPADDLRPATVRDTHCLSILFPRYYPSMPAELYLDIPVFHPNVHPSTGFVCLWNRHRVQTTCSQALFRLQSVLAGHLLNSESPHVMQPQALRWYQYDCSATLPLACIPVRDTASVPDFFNPANSQFRRRLSPWRALKD